MCWNEYVSINTFIFGIFVLLLIAFNNKYSKYKIIEFENPYTYFFMGSLITMQFIEFVLWRNLNNKSINKTMSILGSLLLGIQPIASLTLLKNINLRNTMILIYSILSCIFFFYTITHKHMYTLLSKKGHLKWDWVQNVNLNSIPNWIPQKIIVHLFYLFFLSFSFFVNRRYFLIISSSILFCLFYYYYYTDGSAGSLWCLSVNAIMLYYLIQLLVYLPLREKLTNINLPVCPSFMT